MHATTHRKQHCIDTHNNTSTHKQGLDERERAPADELPVLAASALVSAALLAPSDAAATRHLLHALLTLEAAVATRSWSAPMRLALVALHTLLVGVLLGACASA